MNKGNFWFLHYVLHAVEFQLRYIAEENKKKKLNNVEIVYLRSKVSLFPQFLKPFLCIISRGKPEGFFSHFFKKPIIKIYFLDCIEF